MRLVGFNGPLAEAAKSCFRGVVAAFALGEFQWTFGRGSKILLLRRGCCLCAWWVSRDLWQKQQNPASKERLLPLIMARFIGSSAEAAKSYFRGAIAAFAPGRFQGTSGRSSKILLLKAWLLPLRLVGFNGPLAEAAKSCFLRRDRCLWSWRASSRAVNERRTEQR